MKKIAVLLTILSLTAVTGLSAQNYNWAIGVRGGVTASGITVRHNFDPVNSIEGMLDFAQGFNVYALYERNVPVIASGFNFYYGAGVNIGSWGPSRRQIHVRDQRDRRTRIQSRFDSSGILFGL